MNKIYYFLIALGFAVGSVNAQNDANAKKILDAVNNRIKNVKGINATFSLISKSRAGKVNNNVRGKMLVKGDKYYIKQGASEIFSDGNKTWNYNGNNEVTVTSVDDGGQMFTPQKFLSNTYDKDFTYKLVSSAGSFHEIQLAPKDRRKNFQRVNVFVDKSKMMITRARILDKSGNTIELNLSNINTAANIPDNAFVFDKKKYRKNIEVIE